MLGAVLVNNEALDRVSSFLEPIHFYDPLHGQIYETLTKLIQAGKQATPVTLKTFFENSEPIDANLTVPQYLGRLAANATTIINAYQYGQTIYDLAVRRQLIVLGEDMVNVAFDSPVDQPPEKQIEEAEGRLYCSPSKASMDRASRTSAMRSSQPSTWPAPLMNETGIFPASRQDSTISTTRWAACSLPT